MNNFFNILVLLSYNLIDYGGIFMINKKSIWFLTLFSLILVLSVYYITMPSELLLNTNADYTSKENNETPTTTINESTFLVALRVEAEEELLKEMENLRLILNSNESSIEEKNEAFDKMKELNTTKGEEEKLENKIKEVYQLESFVKIKDDQIEIVVNKKENDNDLANKIMRTIQDEYETPKYITVKFASE